MTGLKKLLSAFLTGIILSVPVMADGTGTVTGSYVNVRSGPGTTYSVIGGCASGTSVSISGESGNWFSVSVNGVNGYMSKSYVSAVTTAATSYGTVTGTLVNIRSGPGTGYSIAASARKNDRLAILENLDGWYKVSVNGISGYISADYFEAEQTNTGTGVTGKVTGRTVNLRSGPGTTYGVVGKALKDNVLDVLGETGGWYKVSYQSGEAYIIGTYLEVSGSLGNNTEPPAEPGTVITGRGVVTGAVVNLRSGPGTSFSIVGQVTKDRAFDVYGETNGWCVVDFNGTKAYISATYISVSPVEASKTGTVTGNVVNLRSGAGTSFSVVGQARNGDCVTVILQSGGWYKIKTAAGLTGYISADYLSVSETGTDSPPVFSVTPTDKTGKVVGAYTNVRKYPTTDSTVITVLAKDTVVKITGYVQSGWYRVEYNGHTGYMSGDFVVASDSSGGSVDTGITPEKTLGEQICEYAMQFIGIPYVYGGSSPSTGFDCSGLTQYVYKHFDYSINRIRQYTEGVPVNKADLKPGDLVFFNTQGTGISHVGMYIGDGQFIHAPSTGRTVCITRLDSDFYSSRYVCAVRIV